MPVMEKPILIRGSFDGMLKALEGLVEFLKALVDPSRFTPDSGVIRV